jgi:transcriptional regulator with XRE-family HTH domain
LSVPSAEKRALLELAERLKAARTAADMTQEAVAAKARIDHRRYQRLEQGTSNTTIRTLVRIAAAVGVDVWDLLSRPGR